MRRNQKPPILILEDNEKLIKQELWKKWLDFLSLSKKYQVKEFKTQKIENLNSKNYGNSLLGTA